MITATPLSWHTGTRSAGSGEIWLFHVSGAADGGGVQLNEKPNWQKDLGEPAFSPDGRYVYYSQDTTAGKSFEYNKDSNKQIFQIFRMDLGNGSVEPFVSGPGGAVRLTPSPDGKYLAFVRRVRNQSTLFLKDLGSGREFPVWDKLERDMQEAWSVHGVYPGMSWTPDGKAVVVWAGGKIRRVDVATRAVETIPFRVQATREVAQALRFPVEVAPDSFRPTMLRGVEVAPDGTSVVFETLGRLWVRALPDGAPRRLTKQDEQMEAFPAFSRDGKWIAYATFDDHREAELTTTVGGERVAVRDAFRVMWDDSADELRTTSAAKLAAMPQ